MNIDWNKWAEELFDAYVKAIRDTDPKKNADEWQFYWECLLNWKLLKERQAKVKEE